MSETSKPSIHEGSEHQFDEQSLPEEYLAILERGGSEEEGAAKFEECYCSFFDQDVIPKPTLEEYQQRQLRELPLFANVLTLDGDEEKVCIERPSDDPNASILVTGFGIRNLASLQNALDVEERRRLFDFYKKQKASAKEKEPDQSTASTPSSHIKESSSKRSVETETELSSAISDISVQQEKVRYLMGLESAMGEEESYPQEEDLVREMFAKESEDKFFFAPISTTRTAQTYLRSHRIFDFFQFLIAHLLSKAPENPLTFILVLLNKILLYRSGTGSPPLLYERNHIEQLFRLMDRMNSGYIDLQQYESGMNTLGICEYNKKPQLSEDGLVPREVFIQEALEAETALFNDLIKRKWSGVKPKLQPTFSNVVSPVRSYISGCSLLIPPDLTVRKGKHENIPEETEEA